MIIRTTLSYHSPRFHCTLQQHVSRLVGAAILVSQKLSHPIRGERAKVGAEGLGEKQRKYTPLRPWSDLTCLLSAMPNNPEFISIFAGPWFCPLSPGSGHHHRSSASFARGLADDVVTPPRKHALDISQTPSLCSIEQRLGGNY
jgi:hypothetical protein